MGIGKSKVFDLNLLQRKLNSFRPADQIRLKIYRRGKGFMYFNVNLKEIPKNQDLPGDKDLF
jgi:hypothetical protein